MLRPFPQYCGVNADFVNLASSNYNSLQITLQKRMSSGLTFNINHTWSKTLSDARLRAAAPYFWETRRPTAKATAVTCSTRWSSTSCRSAEAARSIRRTRCSCAGQWLAAVEHHAPSVGSAVSASSAPPASCRTPAAAARPTTRLSTGPVRINGEWGSGDLLGARPAFLDASGFMNPAAYTYGDTPGAGASGLYGPGFWNEDVRRHPAVRHHGTLQARFLGGGVQRVQFGDFNGPRVVRHGTTPTSAASRAAKYATVDATGAEAAFLRGG